MAWEVVKPDGRFEFSVVLRAHAGGVDRDDLGDGQFAGVGAEMAVLAGGREAAGDVNVGGRVVFANGRVLGVV